MAEASKKLAIKTQVENALDLRDENRKKKKKTSDVWFRLFYW